MLLLSLSPLKHSIGRHSTLCFEDLVWVFEKFCISTWQLKRMNITKVSTFLFPFFFPTWNTWLLFYLLHIYQCFSYYIISDKEKRPGWNTKCSSFHKSLYLTLGLDIWNCWCLTNLTLQIWSDASIPSV